MHSLGAGTTLENDLEQQALAGDEIAKHLWHNYELVKGYLSKEYYRWVQINCPYYTDHGEQHIQSVIRAASMLLGRYRADHHLPPLDIFLLLSAILWHDVGNVFERSKHAEIIAPMTEEIKNIGFSDPSVQRMVVEIAGAHTRRDGLTGPRSSADCVLLSDATLTTNPQELAAILRFADEVSENRARVSEKMIPQVKLYLCTFCLTTTCCCSSSAATVISSGQKLFYLTIIEKCKDSDALWMSLWRLSCRDLWELFCT